MENVGLGMTNQMSVGLLENQRHRAKSRSLPMAYLSFFQPFRMARDFPVPHFQSPLVNPHF